MSAPSCISNIHTNTNFVENKEHIEREYKHAMLDNMLLLNLLFLTENNCRYYYISNGDSRIIPLGRVATIEYLDKTGRNITAALRCDRDIKYHIKFVNIIFESKFTKLYDVTVSNLNIVNRNLDDIYVKRKK